MSFKLREYQRTLRNQAANSLSKVNSTLIYLPTGGGKTALAGSMIAGALAKRKTSWFICHRRELITQTTKTFDKVGIDYGVIAADRPMRLLEPVQVCSVQTLVRRLGKIPLPNFIIWDEAHHLPSATWSEVFRKFKTIKQVGLSATPERLDGKGLDDFFDDMVKGPSVSELIADGWLSDYKIFAPFVAKNEDMTAVKIRAGDFDLRDYAKRVDSAKIVGDAVGHYMKLAYGKRGLVFSYSIEHSQFIVEQFRAAGVTAEHIDGNMDSWKRDAAIERFRLGHTMILSNVELVGEGFDLPEIEVAILLRPTQSLALYLQQVGRVLRAVYPDDMPLDTTAQRKAAIAAGPKPYALILDHVGNSIRHGLLCMDRDWSLAGNEKKKSTGEAEEKVKLCKECFAVNKNFAKHCRECGSPFISEGGREVDEETHVDLTEIDLSGLRRRRMIEEGNFFPMWEEDNQQVAI